MRNFDLTPLFRSTVGFDHLNQLLDAAFRADEGAPSYPPYNIEKTGEDAYLNITAQENSLVIAGKIQKPESERRFLHRGIAERGFERRFELADHIRVSGATLANGLLHVDLVREVPEAMKPRAIRIERKGNGKTVIEGQAAA